MCCFSRLLPNLALIGLPVSDKCLSQAERFSMMMDERWQQLHWLCWHSDTELNMAIHRLAYNAYFSVSVNIMTTIYMSIVVNNLHRAATTQWMGLLTRNIQYTYTMQVSHGWYKISCMHILSLNINVNAFYLYNWTNIYMRWSIYNMTCLLYKALPCVLHSRKMGVVLYNFIYLYK